MSDGYYSGDKPNMNLRKFVDEHATPYDPEADSYNVSAFNEPITTSKVTAIYNMHTYWSKTTRCDPAIRPPLHYPGGIVLDPFCGSGGTALAALMENRNAIAIDRSPAATFIREAIAPLLIQLHLIKPLQDSSNDLPRTEMALRDSM